MKREVATNVLGLALAIGGFILILHVIAEDDSMSGGSQGAVGSRAEEAEPALIEYSGSGKDATENFVLQGSGVTIFDMQHHGHANFAVWLMDAASGDKVDLLVNTIGRYRGSNLIGPDKGQYLLDVEANGLWQIKIRQPRPSDAVAGDSLSGEGPTAAGPLYLTSGARRFTISHVGSGNFALWLYDNDGKRVDLLANVIGSYGGTKALGMKGGIYWFDVHADGVWKISIK